MSRFDFMRKLEELLSDIPPEERAEALKYYNDYFDDAGVLNEANIIRELETPERIASIIKADLRAEGDSNHDMGWECLLKEDMRIPFMRKRSLR